MAAITLVKGQKISLQKEGGELATIAMGLGWDPVEVNGRAPAIDLDASCVMFDADKKIVDTVWFRQLNSRDRSVTHTGDNRTGQGDGDDEVIEVDLRSVPSNVTSLVFVINSFTGQTFDQIDNAFCRLVNLANGEEIARYTLTGKDKVTAQIMAKLYRHNKEWKMSAIGEAANGRTFQDLLPNIMPHL